MSVDYSRLWQILEQRNMKKIQLQREARISGNILLRLKNNEYVSLETIEKICSVLKCTVDDFLEFK